MDELKKIFHSNKGESNYGISAGQIITELSNGENLVDGQLPSELAIEKKDDIEYMKKCCEAEINMFKRTGLAPAPYFFERVASLSKKEKKYEQEIEYSQKYIDLVNKYMEMHKNQDVTDIKKSPKYKSILKRLIQLRGNTRNCE